MSFPFSSVQVKMHICTYVCYVCIHESSSQSWFTIYFWCSNYFRLDLEELLQGGSWVYFKESTHEYLVLNSVTLSKEFIEEGQLLARTKYMYEYVNEYVSDRASGSGTGNILLTTIVLHIGIMNFRLSIYPTVISRETNWSLVVYC